MLDTPPLATYRLLFIDDHPVYGEGLAFALTSRVPGLSVETLSDERSALVALQEQDFDLLLCDYRLVGTTGLEVMARVSQRFPSVALGLLCADVTPLLVQRAVSAGAVACLSKRRDMDSLAQALLQLLAGDTVFDDAPPDREQYGISNHRLEIIRFASNGLSNKQIGNHLGISERTIKDHWQVIFERLNTANRIESIQTAQSLGLIDVADTTCIDRKR